MAKAACHPIYIHTAQELFSTSLYSQNMLTEQVCRSELGETGCKRGLLHGGCRLPLQGWEGQVLGVYLPERQEGGQLHPGRTVPPTTESQCGLEEPLTGRPTVSSETFQSATAAPPSPRLPKPALRDLNHFLEVGAASSVLPPWAPNQAGWPLWKPSLGSKLGHGEMMTPRVTVSGTRHLQRGTRESRHSKINRQKADPRLSETRVGKWGMEDGNVLTPN